MTKDDYTIPVAYENLPSSVTSGSDRIELRHQARLSSTELKSFGPRNSVTTIGFHAFSEVTP